MSNEIDHKKIAIDCFNKIWGILDKKSPNEEEIIEAIRLSHTSTWHWNQVGNAINQQRGEWICARVYAEYNFLESALYHANRCMKITIENQMDDFDLAYSYEALYRVYKKLGDPNNSEKYHQMALDASLQIKDKNDLDLFLKDLNSI